MSRRAPLNDDHWRTAAVPQVPFGPVYDIDEVGEWLPAAVPGDVRLDLIRAGRLPDPYYGMDNEKCQWVDGFDWWYVRDVEAMQDGAKRRFVIFEGIDYLSAVFWNGQVLGRHAGMFSRQMYEIPGVGEGTLAVRVWGSDALPRLRLNGIGHYLRRQSEKYLAANPALPDRLATLKCQMSYGWDFAPRLRTCGIWDEAFLVNTGDGFIRDIWVRGLPDGRVSVELEVDSALNGSLGVVVVVRGRNFTCDPQRFEFELAGRPISQHYSINFRLEDPHPWNPWDRGEPNLYQLQVSLVDARGELDSASTTFGLRTIDLVPNPGAPASEPPWTFSVNRVSEFIRGANWVPADSVPARVGRDHYESLLNLARSANINLVRVWGGGLREKSAFYELCDELGILVWQEFPFSGAPFDSLARDQDLLSLARNECAAIVRSIRNHPSIALWCSGNEFSTTANAALVKTLRKVVAENDGTRPFKPASPSAGEEHNWRVWHWMGNTAEYRRGDAAFYGEFGLQSPPNVDSLSEFIPNQDVWPPGEVWRYHNAQLDKLERYARSVQPEPNTLDRFVLASQEAQLRGLQVMIEYARRRKGRVSGCAFWQFDEPWPAICWSVVDYARRPKPAYFKIKELYNPILVSLDYPLLLRKPGDRLDGDVWIVNDLLRPVQAELCGYLNERLILNLPVQIPADVAVQVARLKLDVASADNALRFELIEGSQVISANEYDLNYCDRGEIGGLASPVERASALFKK